MFVFLCFFYFYFFVGGSGAAVYRATIGGMSVAAKVVKLMDDSAIDALSHEIELLESLPPHEHIVRYLGHIVSRDKRERKKEKKEKRMKRKRKEKTE